ncbi:MAG: hypothetical protein WA710_02725, partial [Pseudolabrys sp.]
MFGAILALFRIGVIGFSVQWHGDQHFLSLDVPIHPAIAGCIYHLALPTEWPMGYNARNDEIRDNVA